MAEVKTNAVRGMDGTGCLIAIRSTPDASRAGTPRCIAPEGMGAGFPARMVNAPCWIPTPSRAGGANPATTRHAAPHRASCWLRFQPRRAAPPGAVSRLPIPTYSGRCSNRRRPAFPGA